MALVLLLLVLLLGFPLVGVAFTSAFNAMDRGERVHVSRVGLRWFLREWGAVVVTFLMHPLGMLRRPPRHQPPPWSAEARPPVILVPGFALNRSSMFALSLHLRRCGWDWVHIVNNEPRVATVPEYARSLALEVEALLRASGAGKVDLVGHSMGGLVIAWYVNRMHGEARVRRVVSLGTPWHGTATHVFGRPRQCRDLAPGSAVLQETLPLLAPLTSIWSTHDGIVVPSRSAEVPGARNIRFTHVGHLDLLYNWQALSAVAESLAEPVEDAMQVSA